MLRNRCSARGYMQLDLLRKAKDRKGVTGSRLGFLGKENHSGRAINWGLGGPFGAKGSAIHDFDWHCSIVQRPASWFCIVL